MTEPGTHFPRDAQAQRTRWELWAIMIIAAVVIVVSLAWRVIGHHHAGPEIDKVAAPPPASGSLPAAAAGAGPHPGP